MSALDSFELIFEDMEPKKYNKVKKASRAMTKKLQPKKVEKKPKESKALTIDTRIYTNFKTMAIPLCVHFASVRGTKVMQVNILFVEIMTAFKRVKK